MKRSTSRKIEASDHVFRPRGPCRGTPPWLRRRRRQAPAHTHFSRRCSAVRWRLSGVSEPACHEARRWAVPPAAVAGGGVEVRWVRVATRTRRRHTDVTSSAPVPAAVVRSRIGRPAPIDQAMRLTAPVRGPRGAGRPPAPRTRRPRRVTWPPPAAGPTTTRPVARPGRCPRDPR